MKTQCACVRCVCVCLWGEGVCACVSDVACNWTENESAACEYFSYVCVFCEWKNKSTHLISLESAPFSS